MTGRNFFGFLGVVFLIALALYFFTTPKGNDIPLIGIVDGNEVVVSPQISGRMTKLTVDEGSEVKKGQLIAELDPSELQAQLAAAVTRAGVRPRYLPSGAGHDAVSFSGVTDIGMLFVRCGNGGISHSPLETITAADADIAARILLDVLVNFESEGGSR